MEAQSVCGNVRYPIELSLCCSYERIRLLVGHVQLQKVEKIGNGLQGIIDFVRDGAGKAAHRSQLFVLQKRSLGLLATCDVTDDGRKGNEYAGGLHVRSHAYAEIHLIAGR